MSEFDRQVVAGTADPDGAAVDPGAAECTEPGRPAGYGRGETLQGERKGWAAGEPGVDREVCSVDDCYQI